MLEIKISFVGLRGGSTGLRTGSTCSTWSEGSFRHRRVLPKFNFLMFLIRKPKPEISESDEWIISSKEKSTCCKVQAPASRLEGHSELRIALNYHIIRKV